MSNAFDTATAYSLAPGFVAQSRESQAVPRHPSRASSSGRVSLAANSRADA